MTNVPRAGRRGQPTTRRVVRHGSSTPSHLSAKAILLYCMSMIIILYVLLMVALTVYTPPTGGGGRNSFLSPQDIVHGHLGLAKDGIEKQFLRAAHHKAPHQSDNVINDNNKNKANVHYKEQRYNDPHRHAADQVIVPQDDDDSNHNKGGESPPLLLTAYIEAPTDEAWAATKPLAAHRPTAHAEKLLKVEYRQLQSCATLPEQFPVNDNTPVDQDPFLPWIHDVFATADGKFVQFIAQNKRRCRTGTSEAERQKLAFFEPQIALFQGVAVQRVQQDDNQDDNEPRFRLTSHEEADADGQATRFVCRFKNAKGDVLGITLSQFNVDYEFASFRKHHRKMFSKEGRDNKNIHTSQLNFQCPVPNDLQETVATGKTVISDTTMIPQYFVDVIPIRTPPRYGPPNRFLQPRYKEFQLPVVANDTIAGFDPMTEWGPNHVIPRIQDSGRWENIPLCPPTSFVYDVGGTPQQQQETNQVGDIVPPKHHRLVSCLWASSGYATRGNRFSINDGQRRLREFIAYNHLIGVDHFYLYDNSMAHHPDDFESNNLKGIADAFPDGLVTWINWPAQVCNNNPNNVDSVGERSSQYAAESSCRLRFGPHTDWIAQFDIDEYLVPMGNYTSILPLLDKLDKEGNKIVSFGSWRAWPRKAFIETPVPLHGRKYCGRDKWDCFQLQIPLKNTMLQSYNCDRFPPGKKQAQMPAEKQLYRPDYVKQHFIHYSTITEMSEMNRSEVEATGHSYRDYGAFPDPLSRFGDEVNEALMLHTKAVATQDTGGWNDVCRTNYTGNGLCRLGIPYPHNTKTSDARTGDADGWAHNCFVNLKIDDYWVPKLEAALKPMIPELAAKLEEQQ